LYVVLTSYILWFVYSNYYFRELSQN